MDKTIRKYTDFDEIKAGEYRYWQSRPVHERVAAVSELSQEGYAMKGEAPVVGAYAVGVHAQPRATKDPGILVKADTENAKAVFAALAKFGASLQGLTPAGFAEPGPFFRMGNAPVGVDVLTKIPASSLMRHGRAALRISSMREPASRPHSFPPMIS